MSDEPRIVVVGAASASFGLPTLSGLFARRDVLRGAKVELVDIDRDSLEDFAGWTNAANDALGRPFRIGSTGDRAEALPGADFVIVAVERDRFASWRKDWEIPIAHGIVHSYGENGGPGGLSHSLRQIPLVLDICRDIEDLAPDALVINYSNPLTRVCLAISRYTDLRLVGLCHGVAMAYPKIGRVMGWITAPEDTAQEREEEQVVADSIQIEAAGLNHITFLTKIEDKRTGDDLYPEFRERLAESDLEFEPLSRALCRIFGLYPAQYDSHVGEYVPWARPDGHPFEERLEPEAKERAALREQMRRSAAGGQPAESLLAVDEVYDDRAPAIVASVVADANQLELAVNIPNHGSIDGLPDWAVVEVPAVVGAKGVTGVHVEPLPDGLVALLDQQIRIQDLVVRAAVDRDRDLALQALQLDPVRGGDLGHAEAMLQDLLSSHAELLPGWEQSRAVGTGS
jgi:alpha-galactosidase